MKTKKCFKCGKVKSLDEFYIHKEMTDGHLGKCKNCTKNDVHSHRLLNIDKIREYDKERSMLPHRVKARKEYSMTTRGKSVGNKSKLKWNENNPEKRAASLLLNNAIKYGRIKKEPCKICGSTKRIHGHHNDYSKPLDVIWLCPQHHTDLHKYINEFDRS